MTYEQRTLDQIDYLTPTSPAWPEVWSALATAVGDYADCCPETGECWQYMGTWSTVHQFRHRNRPATARAILGFPGHHRDRVYLDLHVESLEVARVRVQLHTDKPSIPAALADSRAIGERTEAGREQNRLDRQPEDYGGAFDGFTVTSDADSGL